MRVRDEAARISGEITELRHAIHREPEIGLDLPKTQAKVLAALDGLPLEISTGRELSSVTAVLRGGDRGGRPPGSTQRGGPGPVVLLRGDMDALPVTEETHLPYASVIPGAMHACGHDLHTAMLAGAAGARMIGGGFGGSVLALVPAGAGVPVRDAVTAAFARHGWTAPEFLDSVPSDSARQVSG